MAESAENARFRRALGEAVAVSALPAVWGGYRLPQIIDDVAEVPLDHAGHQQTDQVQDGLDVDEASEVRRLRRAPGDQAAP